jgi:hypothetical protein
MAKSSTSFTKDDPRRNLSGRPKGSLDKFQLIQAKAAARSGLTPLEFMLKLMRGDPEELAQIGVPKKDITTAIRRKAASDAAPYVHRKMPIGIDDGKGGPLMMYSPEQLMALSDEELNKLATIMGKLAVLTAGGPGAGTGSDGQDE